MTEFCASRQLAPAAAAGRAGRRSIWSFIRKLLMGVNGRQKSRQIGDSNVHDRFSAETAAATGKSERVVQRDAERGEKVIDEVMNLIRGTKLDTSTYLQSLVVNRFEI